VQSACSRGRHPLRLIEIDPNSLAVEVTADGMVDIRGDRSLLQSIRPSGEDIIIELGRLSAGGLVDPLDVETSKEVKAASLALIKQVRLTSEKSQKRLGATFTSYFIMTWALFVVGLAAFAAALVRGFTATETAEAVTAAVYGGLSAAAFVSIFISRPVQAMATAGPQAAWMLAIVNTYWTKLAYLRDPATIIEDLDKAEKTMSRSILAYLKAVTPTEGDDTSSTNGGK
jgi:hypothetical protein